MRVTLASAALDIVRANDLVDVSIGCAEMLPSQTGLALGLGIEKLDPSSQHGRACCREGLDSQTDDGS